jgi:quercetin dioxygenase-like cupin family protein
VNDNRREFMAAAAGILAAALSERLVAASDEPAVDWQPANAPRPVATKDAPKVNLDGWQMTAVEITLPPGAPSGAKHHHPGFVIGYVLEGQYSFAVNDQPPSVIKAGEMFFESFDAPGQTHSTSGNASQTQATKFLAIVFTKKGDPVTIPG